MEEEEGDIPLGPAGISANSSIQMMPGTTGGHGGLRGTIMTSGRGWGVGGSLCVH